MKTWLMRYIAPSLGWLIISILGVTLRYRVRDAQGILTRPPSQPIIFAFWHNRILMLPLIYKKYWKHRKLSVMISRSKDGQLITDIAAKFGVGALRGSSSKQGAMAYLQAIKDMREHGIDVGVTPDGPRGPRYSIHDGVLHLAQTTGAPIIPVICHFSKKIELPSWDRFQIPLPFAECILEIGDKVQITESADLQDSAPKENLKQAMGA